MKKLWKKIKKAAKKVANAVVTVIVQVTNIIKEVFLFRAFGLVEFVLALLGVRLPQKLRLHIVILRDEAGNAQATEADLQASIDEARHIFQQEMKVRIIPAYGSFIRTLDAPAPSYVLDVGCDFNAWVEDFGDAGAWFRERIAYTASGILTGYASPVTAFIVRSVAGDYQACSLGPLTDYITLEGKAIKDKAKKDYVPAHILAHELVHACGHIGHIKDHGNLMFRDAKVSGGTLYPWQEALARSSRHVTLL